MNPIALGLWLGLIVVLLARHFRWSLVKEFSVMFVVCLVAGVLNRDAPELLREIIYIGAIFSMSWGIGIFFGWYGVSAGWPDFLSLLAALATAVTLGRVASYLLR